MIERPFASGDPLPWFTIRSPLNPQFNVDTLGGQRVVLCFFGTSERPDSRRVLNTFLAHGEAFDGVRQVFFAVGVDPLDEQEERVREHPPGLHLFWDFDRQISRMLRIADDQSLADYPAQTWVLDERLRLVSIHPFEEDAEQHVRNVLDSLGRLPPHRPAVISEIPAPILILPRVFEPALCRALIDYFEEDGGQESGFMRQVGAKTVLAHDPRHKRRRDREIVDSPLREACMVRIHDRVVPEIHKAFQFLATRIERYVVCRYDSADAGHFRAHRDNTTTGTAHRRFAVSLNLNTGEYTGGLLRFPEFGTQHYQAPAGGAVVFSCSLLHEATPVLMGRRYAFLPFLYDDAAAAIRQQNRHLVSTT